MLALVGSGDKPHESRWVVGAVKSSDSEVLPRRWGGAMKWGRANCSEEVERLLGHGLAAALGVRSDGLSAALEVSDGLSAALVGPSDD